MEDGQCIAYMDEYGENLFSFMLENLGSTDGELRDELIYRLFVKLISIDVLKNDLLEKTAVELVSDHYLYASIGEMNTDTVFTRSFASLWLTALLWKDQQQQFLNPDLRKQTFERSSLYLSKEMDTRGFVNGKGWAHSIAHGADLATMLVKHPLLERKVIPTILDGVASCFWKGGVYTDDEDERLVTIILSLVKQDYPEEVLIEWFEQLFDRLDAAASRMDRSLSFYHARTNILQFTKTLYFALMKVNNGHKLRSAISYFIQEWQNV
ncbi:DUF2785 domain-containing protein [Sporosarcina sp. FSL W8-0480]|uniref:DUF2785 domain-containing protein n=1 Tax=Sporosarcina sp. FSL W8-0480 TaxID=2954701 RepID=UPI0030D97168